jgi:hypothetical protein
MARKPREPVEPEQPRWTPTSIRTALRKLRRRLTETEAFDPQAVKDRRDPQVDALETTIRETLADVFGRNSGSYRSYQSAATIDTAGINMNGTPHHEVIAGLVHGRERSIKMLQTAIRSLEEKMQDDFPEEPLDQTELSGSAFALSSSGADPRIARAGIGRSGAAIAGFRGQPISNEVPSGGVIVAQASPSQAAFDLLMARVALLEAAINASKANPTTGIGHNQGPDFVIDPEIDEAQIRDLITILKVQRPDGPVDVPQLKQIVETIEPASKWQQCLDQLSLSVIKGGGEELGKRLVQAPWWIAVYSQLDAVCHSLIAWLSTLPLS